MSKLKPEDAQKILNRDLFNLVKKVEQGRPLSNAERAIVQAHLDGEERAESAKGWAGSQVELAACLDVDRKTIQRWLKIKKGGPPGAESDGRYNVLDWKSWMKSTGRGGGIDGEDLEDERPRLEMKGLLLRNEKLEFELARLRGDFIPREEVVADVSQACVAIKRELYGMAGNLAPQLAGLSVADIELRIREKVDEALNHLHAGKWEK